MSSLPERRCFDGLEMLQFTLGLALKDASARVPQPAVSAQMHPQLQTPVNSSVESKRSAVARPVEDIDAEKLFSTFGELHPSDVANESSTFLANLYVHYCSLNLFHQIHRSDAFEHFEPSEYRESRDEFQHLGANKRTRYRRYEEKDLQHAADRVIQGATYTQVCADYGGSLPRATVAKRVQEIKNGIAPKASGRPTVLSDSDERWLAAWTKLLYQLGVPVSRARLYAKAKQIADLRGSKFAGKTGYPGQSWWRGFCKRHDLKLARTSHQARSAAQSLTPEALDHFYSLLFSIMDKYKVKPELLFGADETGVSRARGDKLHVVCPAGARRVKQVGSESNLHITLLGCVNALGDRMPPYILRPGQGKRKTINYLRGAPKGSALVFTPKGWSNEDSFMQFIQWFVWILDSKYKDLRSKGEWAVMLVDRHSSRLNPEMLSWALAHRVHLLAYPTNATSLLQTLDVSVHGPFKNSVREHIKKLDDEGKSLSPVHVITKVVLPAWDASFTPSNIRSGFVSTGIWPQDRNKIPAEKLQQAKLFAKQGRVVEHQGKQYDFSSDGKSAPAAEIKDSDDYELLPMPDELKKQLDVPILAKTKDKNGKTGGQRSRLLTEQCFIDKVKKKRAEKAAEKETKKSRKSKRKQKSKKRKRDEEEEEDEESDISDSDSDGDDFEGESSEEDTPASDGDDDEPNPTYETKQAGSSSGNSLNLQPSNRPMTMRTRASTRTEESKAVPAIAGEHKGESKQDYKDPPSVLGRCAHCSGKVFSDQQSVQDPVCRKMFHTNCITVKLRPVDGKVWHCKTCSARVISKS